MAADATWELSGVNDLIANIRSLQDLAQGRAGRSALRAAAQVVRRAIVANAQAIDDPETPNKIPLNIAIQFNGRLLRASGDIGFRVGVAGGAAYRKLNPGKKGPGGDTWYWRLVEFGTKDFAAHPFVRPALGNNTREATDAFLRRFAAAIRNQRRIERREYIAEMRRQANGRIT